MIKIKFRNQWPWHMFDLIRINIFSELGGSYCTSIVILNFGIFIHWNGEK